MSDAKIETMVMITGREYEALRAENEKLRALAAKADEAIARQQQDLEEATDRAADCDTLRAEVDSLKSMVIAQEKLMRSKDAENERLTAQVDTAAEMLRRRGRLITTLRAEVEQNKIDLEEYRRDVEKLRAALERLSCKCPSNCDWEKHGDICPSWVARTALEWSA